MSKHGNFESCKDILPLAWWLNKRKVVQCSCGNFYVCIALTIGYRWELIEMKGKK